MTVCIIMLDIRWWSHHFFTNGLIAVPLSLLNIFYFRGIYCSCHRRHRNHLNRRNRLQRGCRRQSPTSFRYRTIRSRTSHQSHYPRNHCRICHCRTSFRYRANRSRRSHRRAILSRKSHCRTSQSHYPRNHCRTSFRYRTIRSRRGHCRTIRSRMSHCRTSFRFRSCPILIRCRTNLDGRRPSQLRRRLAMPPYKAANIVGCTIFITYFQSITWFNLLCPYIIILTHILFSPFILIQ